MIVVSCEQRSAEWYAARLGKLTGSVAADMLATIKSGEAAARRDLRVRLVVERLTNRSQEDAYINAAMQHGIDCEPAARMAYEVETGDVVMESGFLQHDTLPAGCSIDGYVGDYERIVSFKCPKSATHLRYLRAGTMPSDYVPQMLMELWISGAQVYDFVSYDPRFPEPLQMFRVRQARNESAIAEFAAKALAFLEEVERELEAVQTITKLAPQLAAAASMTIHAPLSLEPVL